MQNLERIIYSAWPVIIFLWSSKKLKQQPISKGSVNLKAMLFSIIHHYRVSNSPKFKISLSCSKCSENLMAIKTTSPKWLVQFFLITFPHDNAWVLQRSIHVTNTVSAFLLGRCLITRSKSHTPTCSWTLQMWNTCRLHFQLKQATVAVKS